MYLLNVFSFFGVNLIELLECMELRYIVKLNIWFIDLL